MGRNRDRPEDRPQSHTNRATKLSLHSISGAALSIILGLSGCSSSRNQPVAPASGKPTVVVTTSVLCDLTHQIAAETIDLVCLLPPGSDPHIYRLTPADRQRIEEAQLILYGGYDLEPELIRAIGSTANPAPKVAVNELAVPQPQKFNEDGKSTTDPHVWHDAKNGIKIVKIISNSLAEVLPARAPTYHQHALKLTSQLNRIDRWIRTEIKTIPIDKRAIFTTHDALGYYGRAYQIPIASLTGLSTEERPNAAHIREIVDKIKATKVPTIFVESTVNPQAIETISTEAKVKVSSQKIYADGLGAVGSSGGSYQQMLITNTQTIVIGLGGIYTPEIDN